jgi:hypothetical protein
MDSLSWILISANPVTPPFVLDVSGSGHTVPFQHRIGGLRWESSGRDGAGFGAARSKLNIGNVLTSVNGFFPRAAGLTLSRRLWDNRRVSRVNRNLLMLLNLTPGEAPS